MARIVPARLRATGQALFSAVVFGGGNVAGYWLSGVGYDRLGGVAPLYAIAAAVELVPLALAAAIAGRLRAART
jgi:PPP family 3-phenylpropionic acid transporter